MKVKVVTHQDGRELGWRHWCPGCRQNHVIYADPNGQGNGHYWRFNGDLERPTFEPSINIVGRCHCFLRNGRI